MSDRASSEVHGYVAEGFGAVRDAFAKNFDDRAELGAAFAVCLDGRAVVDLWGGVAQQTPFRPWTRETLQLVFSGTKGFVAVCLLLLLERGQLDLDAPVARYWPEFGAAGKTGTLVKHVVSHQGGVPGIRQPLTIDDLVDDRVMARLVAEHEPFWPPGTTLCYHSLTFGWICGELIRRIDGRSVGRFFAEEVAGPLALEIWIGLPEGQEPRVAETTERGLSGIAPAHDQESLEWAIDGNPPGLWEEPLPWNTRSYRCSEIPGAGAIGSARSIARLYGCLARGGEIDGIRLLSPESVDLGRRLLVQGADACSGIDVAFGVGFQVQTRPGFLGPMASAFGHGGAGGSMHGAWPDDRVGFSYVMNEMHDDNDRSDRLLRALRDTIEAGRVKDAL